jgi:hypothetical protein
MEAGVLLCQSQTIRRNADQNPNILDELSKVKSQLQAA